MENSILVILLILTFVILLFLLKSKKVQPTKSAEDKKHEIVLGFKKEMRLFLEQNSNNETQNLAQLKTEYLKQIHTKLHNNIYFTDAEVKKIIQELALM